MKKINLKINQDCYNIWRYSDYYNNSIKPKFRLTLEEGWTKEIELSSLAKSFGLKKIWVKRDDLNPTGSHKARSLAYQVSKYYQDGCKNLLISSSGNAACAGAAYSQLANINFSAFISPQTDELKINLLKKYSANIIISSKPINISNYISRIFNIVNLRPSIDAMSPEGYKSIAFELVEKGIFPDAIFISPTSASTLVGIGRAYDFLKKEFGIKPPQIHAVQYGDITSLAEKTNNINLHKTKKLNEEKSRLGIKHTPRENEALKIINNTNGSGWIVTNKDVLNASAILNKNSIITSYEGNAAFAGLIMSSQLHKHKFKEPLCLLTGHHSQWTDISHIKYKSICNVDDYLKAKKIFEKILN